MNPVMNTTVVPEPATLALLLFAAWLAISIILLRKPRLRAAGIVVLVAPLLLAMIAIPYWWLAPGVWQPTPTWQHHATSNGIDFGADHGSNRNIVISRSASTEHNGQATSSEEITMYDGAFRSDAIVFILLTVLLLGGLAATVTLLAFRKTRTAGIAMLAIGVPAAVLLVGLFAFIDFRRIEPVRRAQESNNVRQLREALRNHEAARAFPQRIPDTGIPVETTEKVEVKSTKPAPNPLAAAGGTKKPTPVKATTADEKKPATTKPAAAPAPAAAKKPPAWVDEPPRLLGDTYQMTVRVGPYTTRQECEAVLPGKLQEALNQYVETCLGEPAGTRYVALPYAFLRQEVVRGEWEEEIQSPSVGRMTQLHVLLQFDRKVKNRIVDERRRAVVAGRLWMTGGGLAWVLWLLAVMYGYLRIDLKTGGVYRRRLRFAAVLAILGPVAAAVLVVA
jgi:hypothetical protein